MQSMPISEPISLLLSCHHHELAVSLCSSVVQAAAGRIAGEPTNHRHVASRAAAIKPHVLLLELLPADEAQGWRLLARVHEASAASRILLLCDGCSHHEVVGLIQRGVDGCLLKTSEAAFQARAVVAVHAGETWFGRNALLEALRSRIAGAPALVSAPGADETESLTQRERQILGLIGNALTNKEIARRLKISDNTVKTHLHRIYVKLHQSGRYKAFMSNVGAPAAEFPSGQVGPAQ